MLGRAERGRTYLVDLEGLANLSHRRGWAVMVMGGDGDEELSVERSEFGI